MNANVQFIRRTPEVRYARVHGWIVDAPANRLTRGDLEVRLTPKAMSVLRELLARPATVVRRDDLLGIVWRDGFPTDDVLTHAITELRRALEDDPRAPRIIETIPKVGYRLLAGPSLTARVVGLDGLLLVGVSVVVLRAMQTGEGAFLPAAVVVTLGGFLGTSVVARFIEGRGR